MRAVGAGGHCRTDPVTIHFRKRINIIFHFRRNFKMANVISVTTSREEQLKAALFLSKALSNLSTPHAYIGGFAWAVLGSRRATEMSSSPVHHQ